MKSEEVWAEIQPQVEEDISEIGVPRGEFVVSKMTHAIANSMKFAHRNFDLPQAPALDIGTGTGYHTILLLALGQKRIFSIDINEQAIDYAKERVSRFYPDAQHYEFEKLAAFEKSVKNGDPSVNFYPHSLDDIAQFSENAYSLASFNPPILYPFFEAGFDEPATQGVYFETDDVKNKENDLVYKFYETIARKNLAKGSHILCIWANLNRHLVEMNPFMEDDPEFVHPAPILEKWFDFKFDNEPESFEDFYCHTTILGASFFNQDNKGEIYSRNIRHGIENQHYSKLLIPGDPETMAGTKFEFGVLHLVKTSDTEDRFTIVNGSSK
jgi:SAM-dependent methyltransferase